MMFFHRIYASISSVFRRLKVWAVSFVLLFTFSVGSSAELSSSADSLMRFAGNIHQFNSIFPQEKVYLQFDNTSYYTGETVWFKAFVVNASTLNRPQSRVLYVDLISPNGILLKREKLKIIAGQADGSFVLIDGSTAQARNLRGILSFPSGFYEIRAYTAYMQNFGKDVIFSRVFAVYDKPKEEGRYYDESPTITVRENEIMQKRPETPRQNNINATFHPEGGHIIAGVPNRVAFKVTGEDGFGIDATGTVQGTDISFGTVHAGMGSFVFTPVSGRNTVEITTEGGSRTFNLPNAEDTGLAVQIDGSGPDSITVNIIPSGTLLPDTIGMTITCRGELMDFATLHIDGEPLSMDVSLYGIPEGVCRLTLFDTKGNIYANRSFYHFSTTSFPPVLTVNTDKNKYGFFEKVKLSFDLKDNKGAPLRDRFCLSVRDIRGQDNKFNDDLRTSMLLTSDLKGLIENPSYYFESNDDEHLRALDLLCMVQGWERYDWRKMTGVDDFREVHRLEESLTLNGWILNPSGRKPMSDVRVSAALIPTDKTLTETFVYNTDSSGYFGFDIGVDFYEQARFNISANVNRERLIGTSARIVFERSVTPEIRAFHPGETLFYSLTNRKVPTLEQPIVTKLDESLPTVINVDDGLLLPEVDIEDRRKYVDYYTFNAYDVMKDVEIDLDKGEYTTDIIGYLIEKGYQIIEEDSGFYINGFEPFMYVHNATKYQNTGIYSNPGAIDTRDVISIMVYDKPMYKREAWLLAPFYIDYLRRTVTNVEGSPEEYDRVIMVDVQIKEEHQISTREELYKIDRRVTTVDGWSTPYSFYAPSYPDGPVLGDVDYRRTLYWNPNVITDSIGHAEVEFYNNSITEHINISAAGMTSSGLPYIYNQDR